MKFLVIFGAFLVLCSAKPSSDLMNESSGDGESMEATNWSYVVVTDEDIDAVADNQESQDEAALELVKESSNSKREIENLAAEIAEKNRIIEQQSKTIDENSKDKIAENVVKLLGLVQINRKNEQDLETCMANLASKNDKVQKLEATIEDMSQMIEGKDEIIEEQTMSIEELEEKLTSFSEKSKKIEDIFKGISLEYSQIQKPMKLILSLSESTERIESFLSDF
jgi:chromosome segregation ATPase